MTLPDILSDSEEGFYDLTFAIASHAVRQDGAQVVAVRGAHGTMALGFSAVLSEAWEPFNIDGIERPLHRGTVALIPDGPESNEFIKVLDSLYGTGEKPPAMRKVVFTAFALSGYPPSLTRESVHLKLFFETDSDETYAEVYLNIDLRAGRVELREKDPEYRRPLVRALADTEAA
jgi:hypothetical protein